MKATILHVMYLYIIIVMLLAVVGVIEYFRGNYDIEATKCLIPNYIIILTSIFVSLSVVTLKIPKLINISDTFVFTTFLFAFLGIAICMSNLYYTFYPLKNFDHALDSFYFATFCVRLTILSFPFIFIAKLMAASNNSIDFNFKGSVESAQEKDTRDPIPDKTSSEYFSFDYREEYSFQHRKE